MRTITRPDFWLVLWLLLIWNISCSKKENTTNPEPTKRVSANTTQSDLGNPESLWEASGKSSSSPIELAQMLMTTGNRESAFATIRRFAMNNPSSLPEMLMLVRSSDPSDAVLGAQGLAALASHQSATELISAIQGRQPGSIKRELSEALANLSNPEAAGVFLGVLSSNQDPDVVSGAQRALANSADDILLKEVVQRYEASYSDVERDNLTAAIRYMQTTNCVEGLLTILNQQRVISNTDPLGLAVVDTLGIIGSVNAVSNLFQHLSSLREGNASPVFDAIGRVSNPESLPFIASVAYGQVAGSTLYSRMAAVQALGNYNSNVVYPVLNWLAQNDSNVGIREAAEMLIKRKR